MVMAHIFLQLLVINSKQLLWKSQDNKRRKHRTQPAIPKHLCKFGYLCGLPQGSILGPTVNLYMLRLIDDIKRHQLS